jgi:hypothetical protein
MDQIRLESLNETDAGIDALVSMNAIERMNETRRLLERRSPWCVNRY